MSNTLNFKHSLPHGPPTYPATSRTNAGPLPGAKLQDRLEASDDRRPVPVKRPASGFEMNSSRSVQRHTLLTALWLNPFVLPTDKGSRAPDDETTYGLLAGRDCPPKPQMPDADARLRISDSPPGNPTFHAEGPG